MKTKIWWALSSITCILVLSSVISIIEYDRVSSSVSALINEDVSALRQIKRLENKAEQYNLNVLEAIKLNDSAVLEVPHESDSCAAAIQSYVQQLSPVAEVDSVLIAFNACTGAYHDLAYTGIRKTGSLEKWYKTDFRPHFDEFQHQVKVVDVQLYERLNIHSASFQDAFYRSIVPGMVALASGLVLVFLLGYFFLSYYVHPIYKMLNALEAYSKLGRMYNCKFEGDDQLAELNAEVADLVEENFTLKKRLKSCQVSLKEEAEKRS